MLHISYDSNTTWTLHRVRRRAEHNKCDRLAEAMLNDPNRGFWSEARRFFSKRSVSSAPVVDGVAGVDDIARLWGDRFKELYNTADDSISSELLLSLDSSTTLADIEQISVSFQLSRRLLVS